jgi:hypothetical protein
MKPRQTYLKMTGAFLLLVSLFLPLSSCERYVDKQGEPLTEISEDRHLPPGAKAITTYHYFYRKFPLTDLGSWLLLAGFTWPVFMVFAIAHLKGRARVACRCLEVPLLFGSVEALSFATMFSHKLEVGAYVAYTGIGVYGLGALWSYIGAFRQWKAAKATKATESGSPEFSPPASTPPGKGTVGKE